MGAGDAAKFPIVASGMLFGLYILIKFIGKQVVNYLLLAYFAVGQVESIKEFIYTYSSKETEASLKKYDEVKYLKG